MPHRRRPGPRRKKAARKPAAGRGRGKPKVHPTARRKAAALVESAPAPRDGVTSDERGMRLNRWLAEQGVDSRRKCDALVLEGAVEVDGEVVTEPGRRVLPGQEVRVNGVRIKPVRRLYYLFYKPKGVLVTNDPRETRPRVCDLVDPLAPSRVYPVGRLDEDSEGLLVLTNDGAFAEMVAHPRHGVPKTYVCLVPGSVSGDVVAELRKGTWLDGVKVVPERVRIVRRTPKSTSLEVVLREGRNREIRRLLARHGLGVKRLKRVRIGPVGVQGLKRGQLRPLTREERDALVAIARGDGADASAGGGRRTGRRGAGKGRPKR